MGHMVRINGENKTIKKGLVMVGGVVKEINRGKVMIDGERKTIRLDADIERVVTMMGSTYPEAFNVECFKVNEFSRGTNPSTQSPEPPSKSFSISHGKTVTVSCGLGNGYLIDTYSNRETRNVILLNGTPVVTVKNTPAEYTFKLMSDLEIDCSIAAYGKYTIITSINIITV